MLICPNLYLKNRFSLSFANIASFSNDDKTRSFLALEVGKGSNEVLYYEVSLFHQIYFEFLTISWNVAYTLLFISVRGIILRHRDGIWHNVSYPSFLHLYPVAWDEEICHYYIIPCLYSPVK